MADEEKNEQDGAAEAGETPEAEAAEASPEQEAAPEADEQEAAGPEQEAAPEAEEGEAPGPKQARKRARSLHAGEPLPQRSAEERARERSEARRAKAVARGRRRASQRAERGEPGTGTPPAEREPGPKKLRQGIVTSSKADKTITVEVESARRHPAYEKIVRRSKSLRAHDENNEAGEGDTVRVVETRPMSKTKRWRLVEVVEKAK